MGCAESVSVQHENMRGGANALHTGEDLEQAGGTTKTQGWIAGAALGEVGLADSSATRDAVLPPRSEHDSGIRCWRPAPHHIVGHELEVRHPVSQLSSEPSLASAARNRSASNAELHHMFRRIFSSKAEPRHESGLGTFRKVCASVRADEVGRNLRYETPFGPRLVCYADLTASGRFLGFIEEFLSCLPRYYANSHTNTTFLGRVMTDLREGARDFIARALNCNEHDAVRAWPVLQCVPRVLFAGNGATGALNKLVGLLGITVGEWVDRTFGVSAAIPPERRPIVLIGPYEHHSNILPWQESVAEVREIGLSPTGQIDYDELERVCARPEYKDRPLRIGSFSIASNVTGVVTDIPRLARILRSHGFLVSLDCAGGGPYAPLQMHDGDVHIDAMSFSVHKFVGGPMASGVLVVNRGILERNHRPVIPGGGTVLYVGPAMMPPGSRVPNNVMYTSDLIEREEGGTPAILNDVRSGMAFVVKAMAGPRNVYQHELDTAAAFVKRLRQVPNVKVMGPDESVPRLCMIAFNVRHLHHALVSTLLDHLFGIQSRSGCSCAGPYGQRLLPYPSEALAETLSQQRPPTGLKFGWTRLTLPWYFSPDDIDFLLQAVEFVAQYGHLFLLLYEFDWMTGVWTHESHHLNKLPIGFSVDELSAWMRIPHEPSDAAPSISDTDLQAERATYLAEAKRIADELQRRWDAAPPAQVTVPRTGNAAVDALIERMEWHMVRYRHLEALTPATRAPPAETQSTCQRC